MCHFFETFFNIKLIALYGFYFHFSIKYIFLYIYFLQNMPFHRIRITSVASFSVRIIIIFLPSILQGRISITRVGWKAGFLSVIYSTAEVTMSAQNKERQLFFFCVHGKKRNRGGRTRRSDIR